MTGRPAASYYLEPGFVYFSKGPGEIRTVVGSCVAVCLWDGELRYGGMNHFLRPVIRQPDRATPQYGNVATAALIRMMERAGCARERLAAQIIGGGAPGNARQPHLGERNVEAARRSLARRGVAVVSEDVGGCLGRKIVFDIRSGEVAVLKVRRIREMDWLA